MNPKHVLAVELDENGRMAQLNRNGRILCNKFYGSLADFRKLRSTRNDL